MKPSARSRVALVLAAALIAAGGAAVAVHLETGQDHPIAPRAAHQRPTLALLTSLPLLFAEEFSIAGGGSPALARLEQHYHVQPVGIADAASLAGKRLLLMAHPRAQPAEVLVELDQWVRSGGRLVLLADPRLDWDSARPLGDRLRPPPFFADTGLLAHWGLKLEGPIAEGPAVAAVDGAEVMTASPGRLVSSSGCKVTPGGLVARCAIGAGKATVIADADFLNVAGADAVDGATLNNLELMIRELARVEAR